MRRFFYLFLLVAALVGCEEMFEYHPNQMILKDDEKDLTIKHKSLIKQQQPSDTLRIVFMGDSQRFYDDVEDFVSAANKLDKVDFVVHAGDISDFGLTQEFRWINQIMKKLQWPYLTVVGNHDLLANGKNVYQKMYGPLNYSFVYGDCKFIFIDCNSREYNFNGRVPDIGWLEDELKPKGEQLEWKQAIVISHVPPFDRDFDRTLERPYHQALAKSKRVRLSLHGHQHKHVTSKPYDQNITYHVTSSMKKRSFSLIKIWEDGFDIEQIDF